jgi:hypothetical protein
MGESRPIPGDRIPRPAGAAPRDYPQPHFVTGVGGLRGVQIAQLVD